MATIEDLFSALRAADRAGNVEDATKLAKYISDLGYGPRLEPEAPIEKPTVGAYVKDIPKALGRGAVGLLETSGIGAAAALPEEYEKKTRAGIESLAAPVKQYLAPVSPEIGESVSSKLASGLGSTIPFFALGPAGAVGRLSAAGLGIAAGAGEARIGAEQAGATPEQRAKATLLGAPTGLLDIIAPEIGPLKSVFTTALARGGVEGLTEASQKVAQNMIARGLYNPQQDVLAGSGEEGAYGAGVGALASLLVDVAFGRRAPSAAPRPSLAPPPAAPVAQPPAQPVVEPRPSGLSAEEALRLRTEADEIEARRQEQITRQEEAAMQAQEQALQATRERVRGMPGITGLPGANEAMMGAVRERQAQEAAAEQARIKQEEADRTAAQQAHEEDLRRRIDQVRNTTFSADPVQNRIVQERLINQYQSELGRYERARAEKIAAEPPEYQPITGPQEVPKGVKPARYTEEEQSDIAYFTDYLKDLNKQLTEAKKEKGLLFSDLTGKLKERKGTMSRKDIDPDNKTLGRLFSQTGRPLEDLVADGSLDDYLPPNNRALIGGQENPNFDGAEAAEMIAEKLRQKDYLSFDAKIKQEQLTRQRDEVEGHLGFLKQIPDINERLFQQRAKRGVEPLTLSDLEAQAQKEGMDTEAIKERISIQYPKATPAQFMGLYRGALSGAVTEEPTFTVDGFQYTAEELEESIAERLTDEEINEYIRQAEAEQAEIDRRIREDRARAEDRAAKKRAPKEERVAEEPTEADVEAGATVVNLPKSAINSRLGDAVEDNDWNRVTDELKKSKNPIIARIGELAKDLVGVTTQIEPRAFAKSSKTAVGGWSEKTNGIYARNKTAAKNEHVIAHEITHALTYFAIKDPRPDQKAAVNRLRNLYRYVKTELNKRGITEKQIYGITNEVEFVAEANSNADFQKLLAKIPYQKKTAWGAFTQAVADLLGIKNSNALTEIIALTEELTNPQTRVTTTPKPQAPKTEEPKTEAKPEPPKGPAGKERPPVLTAPPGLKLRKGRNEQIVLAARELAAGRITKQEYDRYVDFYMPIEPVLGEKLEAPIKDDLMTEILTQKIKQKKKPELINSTIANGTRVGLRMDIPALEWGRANGVNGSVVSIHKGTSPDVKTTGKNISYRSTGHVKNVVFAPRDQPRSFSVAQSLEGRLSEKTPQQTIEGDWINTPPEETFKRVKSLLNDPEWKQVSLDPSRHAYFYDRANRQPVLTADEVLQVGRFVLAKNPVYGKREDFLYVEGRPETIDRALEQYGFTEVPIESKRRYVLDGEDYATLEKDGVRIAYSEGIMLGDYRGSVVRYKAMNKRHMVIDALLVDPDKRGQGKAKEALDLLSKSADEAGVTLYLEPVQLEKGSGLNKKQLEELYSKYGFEYAKPDGKVMVRKPVEAAELLPLEEKAETIPQGLEQAGFERLPKDSRRRYRQGANSYGTWEKDGVRVSLSSNILADDRGGVTKYMADDGEMTIEALLVDPDKRGKGLAKDALDMVTELADSQGRTLYLEPVQLEKDSGLNEQQLTELYSRYGFHKANQGSKVMVREPVKAPKLIELQRTPEAEAAMQIMDSMGRKVAEPEPGYIEKVNQAWDNARDNPTLAKEQALGAFRRFGDWVQTRAFSSDAALNNQISRAILESNLGKEEQIGILLNASLSQTAHSDAIAGLFLTEGNIRWNPEIHKWEGVKDKNNILRLSKQLDEIANKHGFTKEEVELVAHTAFEARRTLGLMQGNENIEAQAQAMKDEAARIRPTSPVGASELNDKANRLLLKRKVIHMTPEQVRGGLTQFELFPDLIKVADTWNGIRENGIRVMVDTGLYTEDEAENLLANADYVPFFREDQIEEGKGPKEFLRSLSVQADKRMKGSMKPVNDIFDNMVRWTQYAVNRGVRNRSALALVDTAKAVGLADQVADAKSGDNVVRVWRDGREQYFNMADPMFVDAFRGLESVSIPTIKFFSKFADILRNSVVLFPVFSVSQLTQDSFAAVFSSGLKPRYALTIPFRAVKEFIQTLRGKSETHDILKNIGAVGVRDFSSAIIRTEAEILAGLKQDKGLIDKIKRRLGNFAMAADNAVRQATYEAAISQGLSRAEAMEKAFEIFNVRRRGSSRTLALAGQVIPFFNAYLTAQNVAYRTLSGAGTSPSQRAAALQTLAATTASVMTLSVIYAMMMGGDDDYEEKATPTRDRLLMVPGMGGFGIPLRADAFILPKVLAEHAYHIISEDGMSDGAKFRASLGSAIANSIFSPTPIPQAIKPIAEGILNYDFFQQKPLVGIYQAKKDISRQFEDTTSELSKLIGKTELISPIVMDHFIRGMFGSMGGAFLMVTNPLIAEMAGTTRPDMSFRDAVNAIPNASAFISKEYEIGLRKDFYALKDVTDRAAATLSDLKQRSPQEIKEYLDDPVVRQRIGMAPFISRISNQLTEIRKSVNMITNSEDPKLTPSRKEEMIKGLREQERQLLKNVDLRRLREMAQM